MKLYHFTIILIIISVLILVIAEINTNHYLAVSNEKTKLDESFIQAIDDAAINLVEIDGDTLTVNKKRAVEDFFRSLYASLGIADNPEKRNLLNNYVPVVAVTYNDGYYVLFSEELKDSDGYLFTNKRWTEKLPFCYEDDDFIYSFTLTDQITIYDKRGLISAPGDPAVVTMDYHELSTNDKYASFRSQRPNSFLLKDEDFYLIRKGTIINSIEKSLTYYCNKHNKIAKQLGITYHFAVPIVDDSEWVKTIDNPSIIVLFQGYPYSSGTDTYNRFAISGSNIKKNNVYYLEQKSWYYLYHKAGCPELDKEGLFFLDEPYYTVTDCVKKGAYACPYCISGNGVYAPEYVP